MKLLIMEESWYCSKVIMAAEELTGRAHYNITTYKAFHFWGNDNLDNTQARQKTKNSKRALC